MTRQGGAATVYGVLYQILGSLEWAVRLNIKGTVRGGRLSEATLILEPSDGGDIQTSAGGVRVVEQWKSRSTARPWSLREIVEKVLPDLYRATDTDALTQYCFVTEGKCSSNPDFDSFCTWLRGREFPEDVAKTLQSLPEKRYRGKRQPVLSAYELFCWIVDKVSSKSSDGIPAKLDPVAARRTWRLLSNFRIRPVRLDSLEDRIDGHLAKLVNQDSEIAPKRDQLCGILLKLASNQDTVTSPIEILRMAELDQTSLDAWRSAFERVNTTSLERLKRWGFAAEFDVRPSPSFSELKPCLLITGESGCGKTFALGSLAQKSATIEHAVVAVRAEGSSDQIIAAIVNAVWGTGFRRSATPPLESISSRLRKHCDGLGDWWMSVLVDELTDSAAARSLLEVPWESLGVRIACAVPPQLAKSLVNLYGDVAVTLTVGTFTSLQARKYLELRGRSWADLPQDVRGMVSWPLLASLYCEISLDKDWQPESEYSLFQKYWERLSTDLRQSSFQDDCANLRELIGASIDGACAYPWTTKECRDHGLDGPAIERLVAVGWLSREQDGRIRIWHFRLLCWAISVELASDFRRRGEAALSRIMSICGSESSREAFQGMELGYVPMDLMWLACDHEYGDPGVAHTVLKELLGHGFELGDVTRELLPTVGHRVISPICEEFRNRNPSQFAYQITQTADLLLRLAKRYRTTVIEHANEFIEDQNLGIAACGVLILKQLPSCQALDGLWRVRARHREWKESAPTDTKSIPSMLESDIVEALTNCTRMQPFWLETAIDNSVDVPEDLDCLADILASSECNEVVDVWCAVKHTLLKHLPSTSPTLISCIDRFHEDSLVPKLVEAMKCEDHPVIRSCITTLSALAPKELLHAIPQCDPWLDLFFTQMQWFPCLLTKLRKETLRTLDETFDDDIDHTIALGRSLEQWLDELSTESIGVLQKSFEQGLAAYRNSPGSDTRNQFTTLLDLIRKIRKPDLCELIAEWSGQDVEAGLVAVGTEWAEEQVYPPSDLETLLPVLLRVQGKGFPQLIARLLQSSDNSRRFLGIQWSCHAPDAEIRRSLVDIALSHRDDHDGDRLPKSQHIRDMAIERLACLGEDDALIRSLQRQEHSILALANARRGHLPMSDRVVGRLIDTIQESEGESKALALMAAGVSSRISRIGWTLPDNLLHTQF